jgi:hypothetical protein
MIGFGHLAMALRSPAFLAVGLILMTGLILFAGLILNSIRLIFLSRLVVARPVGLTLGGVLGPRGGRPSDCNHQ